MLLKEEENLQEWTVLRQKSAECVNSKAYKQKVREDLERTHRLLQINRVLM